ncbi:hypothetical protein EXW45_10105 [Bacillus wiedmannii]|uniref:hypothetical protein n=1 Tax=Bacillus cereus group TaxID=86661 RepID=UPI000BFBB0DF|nr:MULTISPECIES: hypothetical protein [Bacillus cereus group]MDA2607830.1 hypothetical protein [Bacillus cereus]PHE77254.1 hypothetical protein COF77_09885 [Bacillus wiedmannii]QWH71712.1 hypothetical protein EXW45_10105 [Bacillus wiedmannii]
MLLIRLKPAMYFISNFILFLLGLLGIQFFTWLHAIIISIEVNTFSYTCTMLFASVFIYILWKIR